MRLAADFWTSKTTYAGLIGVAGIVLTTFLHRADLVAPITGIIIAVEGMFVRDTIAKVAAQGKGIET